MSGMGVSSSKTRRVALAAVMLCGTVALAAAARWLYMHRSDPKFINYAVAFVPVILSILIAFVPDLRKAHMAWRIAIVAIGIIWSVLLWRQQEITAAGDLEDRRKLLQETGEDTAQQLQKQSESFNQQMARVRQQFEQDLGSTKDTLTDAVRQSTTTLGTTIGSVRPKEPELARLKFGLYPDGVPQGNTPLFSYSEPPNKDGTFPVVFGIANVTDTAAENVDLWIYVCDACSFASEVAPFDKPAGLPDFARHASILTINAGANWGKVTALVKAPVGAASFTFYVRYTCKTCGKMQPVQIATIYTKQ